MPRQAHMVSVWVAAISALLAMGGGLQARAADDPVPTFQLTTKLGATVTVVVDSIAYDDLLLNAVAHRYGEKSWREGWSQRLALRVAGDRWVCIPLWCFAKADLAQGVCTVTLANGDQFRGQLQGTIVAAGREKSYDLGATTSVELVSQPPAGSGGGVGDAPTPMAWQMRLHGPLPLDETVTNPRFELQYYSSEGYAIGGSERSR